MDGAWGTHVTGVDIDAHVLRIAYVQLCLLGVPAVLVHGNTLTLQEWDHYFAFAHVVHGWDQRLREKPSGVVEAIARARELLDAVEAEQAEAPEPADEPAAGQLDLFGQG